MSLKYCLVENLLTEKEGDYSALVISPQSYDRAAVITRMVNRGNLLTKVDIEAVMNALEEEVEMIHEEGAHINMPLLNTSSSISGVFDGPLDVFDPNRHKYNINTTKGTCLRAVEKRQKLEKTNTISPQPSIQEVKDTISGNINGELTPNGVMEVYGYNLKIVGDDIRCGMWFVNDAGVETKVEILIENKPSKILAIIPNLAHGDYQLKVVTQYSGGTLLKNPKTVIYPKVLSIF